MYDAEILFVRESFLFDQEFLDEAELAGIPLSEGSSHSFEVVYEQA